MIVYPAIDIRRGRVVRLVQGDPEQETVHEASPAAAAERWKAGGAEWVHVINLDGALGEATRALENLRAIAAVGLKVQFGGGLRTLDDVRAAQRAGAARMVLGTLVVQQPDIVATAVERFGAEHIIVALDSKGQHVATHGWQAISAWTTLELARYIAEQGAIHALYTDIRRDGDLTGVNVEGTAELARETGLQVIASGGVASLDDIRRCRETGVIAGVIIGRAIYAPRFTLPEALAAAAGE